MSEKKGLVILKKPSRPRDVLVAHVEHVSEA
jgi:hypothetical protein